MQHLLRNQIISIVLLLITHSSVNAQKNEVFRPDYDEMPFHIGVALGLGVNNLNFVRNAVFNIPALDKANVISSPNTGHANLGITGTLRLSNHFILRGGWMFILNNKKIVYKENNSTEDFFAIGAVSSSIPIALKIQSDRYNAFGYKSMMRHYIIGGGNFSLDKIYNNTYDGPYSGTVRPDFLKKTNLSYEYGFGLSFFLRHVTVSPEIKFSYGLTNINDKSGTLLLDNINKINANFINFSIHLEN